MKVLRRVRPTPEQIGIIRRIQPGVSLIRGAAGSGKTSTALTALRASTGSAVNALRNADELPARVLVLSFTNSLRGYVAAVATEELGDYAEDVELYVETFDRWAYNTMQWNPLDIGGAERRLRQLAGPFPRDLAFVLDEVRYVLGRFRPDEIDQYLTCTRVGRGSSPQMPAPIRQRLLAEVIKPYLQWKTATGTSDFHDLANALVELDPEERYDVIVVDEAQDLSTIQLRAIARHAAPDATITIVTDTAQRIYPRGTIWAEAELAVTPNRSFQLTQNYRNTQQIAALAADIATGLPMDADGLVPNPATCQRNGELPIVLWGTFPEQAAAVIERLKAIDLQNETVGFLHLKGGGWFDYLRQALDMNGLSYRELQGVPDWPEDEVNIGLTTFHSAKGLEFDHVFMIGLAEENASYGEELDDDRLDNLRRLVAMGIGRARTSLAIGMEPGKDLAIIRNINRALVHEIYL